MLMGWNVETETQRNDLRPGIAALAQALALALASGKARDREWSAITTMPNSNLARVYD